MRPIKFKIWNKKKNEWHHKEPISLFGEVIIMGEILNANLEDNPISLEELNNLVPLQFTGLLDKNGKEIYEGDIVKFIAFDPEHDKEVLAVVKWQSHWGMSRDSEMAGFMAVSVKDKDVAYGFGGIGNELEIIGNIYENPELLKDER